MRLQAIHKRASGQSTQITPRHLVLPPLSIDLDSFSATINEKTRPPHEDRIPSPLRPRSELWQSRVHIAAH